MIDRDEPDVVFFQNIRQKDRISDRSSITTFFQVLRVRLNRWTRSRTGARWTGASAPGSPPSSQSPTTWYSGAEILYLPHLRCWKKLAVSVLFSIQHLNHWSCELYYKKDEFWAPFFYCKSDVFVTESAEVTRCSTSSSNVTSSSLWWSSPSSVSPSSCPSTSPWGTSRYRPSFNSGSPMWRTYDLLLCKYA